MNTSSSDVNMRPPTLGESLESPVTRRRKGRSGVIRVLQLIVLAITLPPASIAAGYLYFLIQSVSSEWIHLQILIYPGMAAGALVGLLILGCKRLVEPPSMPMVLTIAFCAGLVVFGARWKIEATDNNQGVMEYLSNESTAHAELHFAGGHHLHGHSGMSPLMFWFLFAAEGAFTVLATMRIANGEPL